MRKIVWNKKSVWNNTEGKYVMFNYKDIAYSFVFGKKIIPKYIIQYERKDNGEWSKIKNCNNFSGHRTIKIAKLQ
jgi:hypothetical protein